MNLIENIRLALAGLRTSKMRSFLTMLGIIIGIGSVIAIVTVGNSLTSTITGAMSDLGVNQIRVYLTNREPNVFYDYTESDYITNEMLDRFEEAFAGEIEAVTLEESGGSGQVKLGRKYANVVIYGVNENYLTNSNINVAQGHDITNREILGGKNVAIVSDKLVNKIFGEGADALGKDFSVHTSTKGVLTFSIVGIYEYEVPAFLSAFVSDEDIQTQMVIPITTAKRIMNVPDGYSSFSVMFPPTADSNALAARITDFMDRYYENNQRFVVRAQNMEAMMGQMTSMLTNVSLAIAIIAAISLLVGGIGVMNIMLVSVTERTREIGTRKALGARNSAIRIQFVVEAIIICLIGGGIGILFGLALGSFGSNLLGFPAEPSVPVIIIAVFFSMLIGVFFGYYPANKAAKMDPIEALRYE